ncbi:helix-turn-helix domain-containing protein [Saccharomonospora sp. NPDC046836]|uniref:TetR/AcrR family transcriptional regulator n=1 Tax=Saccharomonospora sp. NPDC046836 TaxID=3156921 RepID=UPI0033E945C3
MPESTVGRPLRADAQRNRLKVLAAAERVLAKDGSAASMREIARQAGVGLATIYRQFPTKEALYEAVVVERVRRLLDHAHAAAHATDPGDAFFTFFTFAVTETTGEKALVDSLAVAGLDPKAGTAPMHRDLEKATGVLLRRAQAAGAVRAEVGMAEVLALITAMCLAADRQHWDEQLRTRSLTVVFDGLRPQLRP